MKEKSQRKAKSLCKIMNYLKEAKKRVWGSSTAGRVFKGLVLRSLLGVGG